MEAPTFRPQNPPYSLWLYPIGYASFVREIRETDHYSRWFSRLRDREARARILVRIRRLSLGNPGDCWSVGRGLFEMRIHHGPGYRVYFVERGPSVVILVAGGSKATQQRDIQRAKQLAQEV